MAFRVFDKKKKRFVKDNIFLTPDGELVESKKSIWGNKMTFIDQNRYVYQRYIGLEDKDNNPIFIGDYLEARVADDEIVTGIVSFAQELSSYVIFCDCNFKYFSLSNAIFMISPHKYIKYYILKKYLIKHSFIFL